MTFRSAILWLKARRRVIRDGLSIAGVAYACWFLYAELTHGSDPPGLDARAYWSVGAAAPYGPAHALGGAGSFLYAPPVALAFTPLSLLPWHAFLVLWIAILVAALVWLARDWTLASLAFIPVLFELYYGNVNLLLAAAIVIGFRFPASWAFVLLTKVTPGVGLLWFAFRREWRQLAVVCATTIGLSVASFLIAPHLWSAWMVSLQADLSSPAASAFPVPLPIRLLASAILVWLGARSDQRWTVPLAATIALPVLWLAGFSVALGVIPLLRHEATRAPLRAGGGHP